MCSAGNGPSQSRNVTKHWFGQRNSSLKIAQRINLGEPISYKDTACFLHIWDWSLQKSSKNLRQQHHFSPIGHCHYSDWFIVIFGHVLVSDTTNQVLNANQGPGQVILEDTANQLVSDQANQVALDTKPDQPVLDKPGTMVTPLNLSWIIMRMRTVTYRSSVPTAWGDLKEWHNRCTHCLLSYYCSVKCQKENCKDHKLVCSLVTVQRAKGWNGNY